MGVEVAKVEQSPLRDDAQTVGTLKSRQNIMLRPEVAGRVVALGFADGSQVRKGQMLVQLDDSLQRAEIQQAQAQMSIAQANHKRNQDLVAQGFIAQRSLDESQASLQVAQAQLALTCARWERMRIVAPFSGTVGLRTINLGDFVKDGADMVNLEDLTQLYVDFRLPERYQSKLSTKQTVEVMIDALQGSTYQARIEAIDPLIDANGRSISVRAVLRNDGATDVVGKKGAPALKPLEPAVATPSPVAPDTACPLGRPRWRINSSPWTFAPWHVRPCERFVCAQKRSLVDSRRSHCPHGWQAICHQSCAPRSGARCRSVATGHQVGVLAN